MAESTKRPDLFVGLIGAVGTTLSSVVELLRAELSAYSYAVETIRLSDLLKSVPAFGTQLEKVDKSSEDDRIKVLMDCGNALRKESGHGDAVLQLGVRELVKKRNQAPVSSDPAPSGTVYIFWSLKHPDEVDALRQIYKSSSHIISVYAPKHVRRVSLANKISRQKPSIKKKDIERKIDDLIDRDQNETGVDLGQNVRDAFHLADLFVDGTGDVSAQISRYIRLLFGDPFITPRMDEYGMFHAKAASLRSADLSRQVGAMILSSDGSHLCAGCNEVPKPGGGHFWPATDDESLDHRDFRHGADKNVMIRAEMLTEVMDVLRKKRWLSKSQVKKSSDILVDDLLNRDKRPNLLDARIASVIEYGRIVHAEMSAITDAARRGVSLKGAKLICTTFPCHMCTRHIIAAGLQEVVYIEPYPKSLAAELYGQSIRIDDEGPVENDKRVHFRPFIGISPQKYLELFRYKRRKDRSGFATEWRPNSSLLPIIFEASPIYKPAEDAYALHGDSLVRDQSVKRTKK